MSDRNNSDYFDFDNFDESLDSRDYRRRQPARRNSSYNGRPSYNRRRPSKRRMRVRTRNRILMVTSAVLVLVLLITLIVLALKGCGSKGDGGANTETTSANTDTKPNDDNNKPNNNKLAIDTFITANPTDNNTTGYVDNVIYVWNNEGFELFGGSEESAGWYADTINTVAGKLSGYNVYSLMIPNHTEMGLPVRLKNEVSTNSQADNIKAAYAAMDKSKVTPVNAYNYLSEHCNEYIYFKSDHHWTGLGSYYAYSAFADALGVPALSLDTCTKASIEGFTGTLSNIANGLDTDTVDYWKFPYSVSMDITDASGNVTNYDSPYFDGEAGGSLAYGVFIYGDNPLTVMKSSSDNAQSGKKIVVVKESYGNAFVPYLTNNFEEVHVVDLRSFRSTMNTDLATYCRNNGITDVLFLNGIMSANNEDHRASMEGLFN